MLVEITVCNTCQSPNRQTRPYTIGQGNRSAVVDLCAEDGKPFESFLPSDEKREPAAALRKSTPPKRTTTKVAAKKRTARKATASKTTTSAAKRDRTRAGTRAVQEVNAQIREWANNNGMTVGDKGKIPGAVKDAYAAANGGASVVDIAPKSEAELAATGS